MIAVIMSLITWCLMLWFVWLFYGALQSINNLDDNIKKVAQNLEVLDDIAATLSEMHYASVSPKLIEKKKKNRVVSHTDQDLAEREKNSKTE